MLKLPQLVIYNNPYSADIYTSIWFSISQYRVKFLKFDYHKFQSPHFLCLNTSPGTCDSSCMLKFLLF